MIKPMYLKAIAFAVTMLVLASLIAMPSITVIADHESEANNGPSISANASIRFNVTISFDKALKLAYIVRNVSYPMLEWSISKNITLAKALLSRGDYFLHKAINTSSTNETRATIYALIAAAIYSRAPVTAYPVLGKTISENMGENHTVTNDTVLAVLGIVSEVKKLVDEAKNISKSYNITPLPIVDVLVADALGKANTSRQLLGEGYKGVALAYAVRAYHEMVKAYSWIIKTVFIKVLNLTPRGRITEKIIVRRVNRQVLERIVSHMPVWVRTKILNEIRSGRIKSLRDLRHEIGLIVKNYKRRFENITVRHVARIVFMVLMVGASKPDRQGQAIRQWIFEHRRHGMMGLMGYIINIVIKVKNETNTTGLQLLNNTLTELEKEISSETGVAVNLHAIFNAIIVIQVIHHGPMHHRHHH